MTFYTPILQLDALEHKLSIVEFDSYYLLPLKVTDAVGNITTLINDYVALQASCTIDANGNKTTLAFDSFSRTVGIAVAGKEGEGVGDSLDDFVAQPTDDQIVSLLDDPTGPKARVLIGKAGQRMVYRNAEYTAGMYVPASYVTVTRDVHAEDTAQLAVDISYLDGMARPIQTASLAIKDAGSGTTTWRINGAEVRDADGLPVKRFLAMFAQSHQFVPYTMLSEAPGIIYFRDPAQRLIGELYPDHTWTKTCITPWRTTKFDTGDTVLAADPAEDRDLGPYFQSLQRNSYKPTWYQNRSRSGNKWDQDAAAKSRQYNSTPTITHFDPLERAIAVVVDNSSKGKYVSQQEFDLLGNPACVWNARGAAVTVALFSLLSCELARTSMDSGQRWTFPDCLGRPLLVWNSRGIRERATYDELGRLTGTWLLPSWGMDEQLVEKRVYGEGQSDATNRNLRGKLVQCYDQSGIWENIEFDFKGNCVLRQVRLACEYKELIDWSVPENPLEETVYKSIHLFNARNQAWKTMAPDGSWTKRTYDVAGMLKTVSFAHASEKDKWTHYIESITYTADREEQVIQYGNKAVTERIFNRETRELDQTVTSRPGSDSRKRQVLVDLQYYRDCCARVTHVLDGAAQDVYFRNSRIEPGQDYAYDAIGQLTEARGREQVDVSHGGGRGLGPYSSGKSSGMLPGDGTRMCRYLEQYKYDSSGNITQMRHIAENDPSIAGWTRDYQYKEPSRLNPANATCDQLSYTTVRGCTEGYSYDERGCMISMPGYSSLTWDFHDRLRSSSTQIVNNGVPEMTWYVYNADGIRIRKVTEGATNLATGRPYQLKETRYFQEYQEYCTSAGKGLQSKLVKKTSKVKREARSTENSSVIALVEYTPLSTTSPSLLPRYQISECLELTGAAQIISYTEYSPYGTTTFASLRNALEAPRQYQFALYERDTETGMHCCGARYYAAWIGRWSSPDPSGIADGPNRYCYVGNDPVRFEDGTGLMRRQDHPGRPDRGGKDNHPGNRPTPYQRPKQASSSQKKDEQGPGSSKSAGDSAITANTKPPGDPPPGRPKEQNSFTVNSDVYVRFQEPHLDQDPVDARVRQKEWATNEGQVTSACRNFFNSGEKPNIMLWRTLDDQTLQYAGYYSSPHALDMVPQSNLSRKNVQSMFSFSSPLPHRSLNIFTRTTHLVSFILPSGVHRLGGPDSQVRANTSDSEVWTSTNIGAVDGIFGINGTLDPETDYAYTTALSFRQDIKSWKNSSDPKVDHIEVHATKMNGDPVLIRIPMRGLK
jgi:RHS repeat-associated protein